MDKRELITEVQDRADDYGIDITKVDTAHLLDIIFDIIALEIVRNERQSIYEFGVFTKTHRKERQGRNPRNGEPLTIPASYSVKFKPGAKLRAAVNK